MTDPCTKTEELMFNVNFEEQREIEEALKSDKEQRIAQKALQMEEPPRKKFKEDKARGSEEDNLGATASASVLQNVNMGLPRKTWTEMKYSPNLKSGAIVHVVFPWTPIDFHVVCDEDSDPLELLQADIMERVCAGKLQKFNGKLQCDDVVIAEYDGAYYRARVSICSSALCQLCFIDYGDKVIKKIEEVYEIPEDLFRTPVYGLKVRLDGLDATNASVGALLSDTVEAVLYETAYSLELLAEKVDKSDGDDYTRCILREARNKEQTLNDAVKNSLL